MRTGRIEAFSDGVLAVLITIMVLELPKPAEPTWGALGAEALPVVAYLLSFVFIGIYWNNHHQLFQGVTRVSGSVLWANLNLLFWLSLVPFATAWLSESFRDVPEAPLAEPPVVVYGLLLLASGVSYWILQSRMIRAAGPESLLAQAVRVDVKGKASMIAYAAGVLIALVLPWVGIAVYAAVAVLWLVPDRRIERRVLEAAADAERSA